MYIIGIDQSTQGTKALLFDEKGSLLFRTDLPHRQIVNAAGWVEHDPVEIYENTIKAVRKLLDKSGVPKEEIAGIGISNQRETALAWDRETGEPVYNAIVWQCARGTAICEEIKAKGMEALVRERTGLNLSPYFSAAKLSWLVQNVELAREKQAKKALCFGTIDSWLIYCMTGGREFKTDYSNASRTQLFNIFSLSWDEDLCGLFGIDPRCLPQVCDSDSLFGMTDLEGCLDKPVPIHGVMGDSHGALFGQGCLERGMIKATYGTGSSVMMNVGDKPVVSRCGAVSSLAWKLGGRVQYVLEGNINYTGAVISWLKDQMGLISSAKETEALARQANPGDHTYLVPAFTGLGAPYWNSRAEAMICGMTRTTGKAEIVKAALDCIAYQIADMAAAMEEDCGFPIQELRVDGGPTRNAYLMQFQSDISGCAVAVPESEELSGIGAAYAAGLAMGIYKPDTLFGGMKRKTFTPSMDTAEREEKRRGWKAAVSRVMDETACYLSEEKGEQ